VTNPTLPLGRHRLKLTGFTLGVKPNIRGTVVVFTALRLDVDDWRTYDIPFFLLETDMQDVDGEHYTILSRAGELAASWIKELVLAVVAGFNAPDFLKALDEGERVQEILYSLGSRPHVVDVEVTEVPTKGKTGGALKRYTWSPVDHCVDDELLGIAVEQTAVTAG
jgi:hypothetical protein